MNFDENHIKTNKLELTRRLTEACTQEGANQITAGLEFYRYSNPLQPTHGVYVPSICIVAQGAKEVVFDGHRLRYDPDHYLLISLDVPVVSEVVEASPKSPYLSLKLELEPEQIASVIVDTGSRGDRNENSVKSMAVSHLEAELLDAFVRLVCLLDDLEDYRAISPMVIREIIYRVLKSQQGARLRQMTAVGGHVNRIAQAIQTLRSRFSESLSMKDLANDLGMSVSSFHQHFKTATSMSPLQFQKQLRLQEARRLLLTEELDASSAAARVGYDDSSQFSREYKRLFGDPPIRDIARFKQLAI